MIQSNENDLNLTTKYLGYQDGDMENAIYPFYNTQINNKKFDSKVIFIIFKLIYISLMLIFIIYRK